MTQEHPQEYALPPLPLSHHSAQAQGHNAPLRLLIPPTPLSPHLLVSSDEQETLKIWDVTSAKGQHTPIEIQSFTLDADLEALHSAHWCHRTPYRLWCMDVRGQVGYYPLEKHPTQAPTFQACPLNLPSHSQGLALIQSGEQLIVLTTAGLFYRDVTTSCETPWHSHAHLPFSLTKALQAHGVCPESQLRLALRHEKQWQIFEISLPLQADAQWDPLSAPQVFSQAVSSTQAPAFFLSPDGHYLVHDRQIHDLQHTDTAPKTYYGRPLVFSARQQRLLWASGDSLFITDLSQNGSITHHQALSYTERFASWPIFWSLAAAQEALPELDLPEFWVADQHRQNASGLWPSTADDTFKLAQSLKGEGGWVESLCFLDQNTLLLGGGQKGSLCALRLHPNRVEGPQGFISSSQPIESLVSTLNSSAQVFSCLQGARVSVYPSPFHANAQELTAALTLNPPAAPWHKALDNGALSQWVASAQGWIAQFDHKGKQSLQAYELHPQKWRVLATKLPEQAVLLAALSSRYLLFEVPGRDSCLKIFDAEQQSWQELRCNLEWIDQVQWQAESQILVAYCEDQLEVWQGDPAQLKPCGDISHTAIFNALRVSQETSGFWTLDNDGMLQYWQVNATQVKATHPPVRLEHWSEHLTDRVVALSEHAAYVALGDRDVPLRIWNGQTGSALCEALVSLNDTGSSLEAVFYPMSTD